MKVISLWQPWATAAAAGIKKIETRSWGTEYRGELLIHAAKKPINDIINQIGAEHAILLDGYLRARTQYRNLIELSFGAIVGKVTIVDCKQQFLVMDKWPEITMAEMDWGDYSDPKRYAWRSTNPVLFDKPIPAKGAQGFWNYALPVCKFKRTFECPYAQINDKPFPAPCREICTKYEPEEKQNEHT